MDSIVLHQYTEDAYLEYAMTTVKGRALAQVEDGQKPVHRRILYAMRQLGLGHQAKYVKSARIVGDVLGKYHPHGDTAAYEAMVRMAQKFSMRYPLVDGQGNFGSRDGDSAAAMRYTEARLTRFAEEVLLSELDQGTVDFLPNYDMTTTEPGLLPARLPVLVLNGTEGIAVGMSADIPPHNLEEVSKAAVHCVQHPDCSDSELLQHIQGPDFPGGGQVVSSRQAIESVYLTGKGTLRLRARWAVESLARGQWQIVVQQLPYQVSTRQVLEEIDALANPRAPAGKKTISAQQTSRRQKVSEFLDKVVDESDKDNEVRIVLTPKTSKVDQGQLMAFLLANTSLEVNVTLNGTCIGLDGAPRQKTVLGMLREWATFRIACVTRRLRHELEGSRARVHILEGRMLAYLSIDKVVHTIRHAENPRDELMSVYGMTETQAEDILEMRLRQLNKLEGFKLEAELDTLKKRIEAILKLLASDAALRSLVASEIEADAKKFSDSRRTLVEAAPAAQELLEDLPVEDEPLQVAISRNLWVKAYRSGAEPTYRPADSEGFIVPSRTTWEVVLLDKEGRSYSFAASKAPSGRGDGAMLSTLVSPQAPLAHAVSAPAGAQVLLASSLGYGFVAPFSSLISSLRAGKAVVRLDGGTLLPPLVLQGDETTVVAATSKGRFLAFPLEQVKRMDKGLGVMLMALSEGDSLHSVAAVKDLEQMGSLEVPGREEPWVLESRDRLSLLGRRAAKGVFAPRPKKSAKRA